MTPKSPEPPDAPPDFRVEPFDPEIHISPHALFRRLKDAVEGVGRAPRLVDPAGKPLPPKPPRPLGKGGQGGEGPDTILIDADGREATRRARELREEGHERVYALYGGLELYDYALDPLVVGAERFLVE